MSKWTDAIKYEKKARATPTINIIMPPDSLAAARVRRELRLEERDAQNARLGRKKGGVAR